MDNISQADKDFMKAFDLTEEDLPEAKANIIGFFELLYRIDQRLKKEKEEKENEANQTMKTNGNKSTNSKND